MADLKVKIIADLKKLKNDIKSAITQQIDVGIKGGKEGKGAGGDILKSLGGIAKILAPVAILLSLKPVADLLSLLVNFLTFALLKMLKFFGVFERGDQAIEAAIKVVQSNIERLEESLDLKQGILDMTQALADSGITIGDSLDTNIGELRDILKEQGFDTEEITNELIREIAQGTALQKIIKQENKDLLSSVKAAVDEGTISQEEADKILEENLQAVPEAIKGNEKAVTEAIEISGKEITDKVQKDIEASDKMVTFLAAISQFKPILDRIANFIKTVADRIGNFLGDILGGFFGKKESVGDAIIKPDGTIIRTDPRDTLIATQNPGGVGGSKVINMFGVTNVEMIETIKRELGTDVNASGRF